MGYGSRAIDLLTRYYEGGLYSGTAGSEEEEDSEEESEESSAEDSAEGSEEESSDEEEEEEGDASNVATGEDNDRCGSVLPSVGTPMYIWLVMIGQARQSCRSECMVRKNSIAQTRRVQPASAATGLELSCCRGWPYGRVLWQLRSGRVVLSPGAGVCRVAVIWWRIAGAIAWPRHIKFEDILFVFLRNRWY